jgi:hypothetical protein
MVLSAPWYHEWASGPQLDWAAYLVGADHAPTIHTPGTMQHHTTHHDHT